MWALRLFFSILSIISPLSTVRVGSSHHTTKKSTHNKAAHRTAWDSFSLEMRPHFGCASIHVFPNNFHLALFTLVNRLLSIQSECKRRIHLPAQNHMLWSPQTRAGLGGLLCRWWVCTWPGSPPVLEIHPLPALRFCSFPNPEGSWQS